MFFIDKNLESTAVTSEPLFIEFWDLVAKKGFLQ